MSAKIYENINPNDSRTAGEEYLLNTFKNSERFNGWEIHEQPHINSMKPDFVLLHPNRGVIIIEVKDWDLKLDTYKENSYIRGSNGNLYKKSPIFQVENYKQNILTLELENSINLAENFYDNYFACIETVIYFHNASKYQAVKFCGNESEYTKIWTREDIEYIKNINNNLSPYKYTYALCKNTSKFNKDKLLSNLIEELSKKLQYSDYHYERRRPFVLDKYQDKLAQLKPGSIRRWGGVAGSGKSLILAEKAVRALKQDNRVLLLSFNITLKHYLRDLCSQQFGVGKYEGERKKLGTNLSIMYFHELLKNIMSTNSINIEIKEKENDFTKIWIETLENNWNYIETKDLFNYDYILIDEGQDFKGDWIRFLKRLLNKNGEMLIVYDKAQDLFDHGIWIEDPNEIKEIGFKGKPGNLKYTYRLPRAMVEKINTIRKHLEMNQDDILSLPNEQISMLGSARWFNYTANFSHEKLLQIDKHVEILRKSNTLEDITIITTNENTGVKIVKHFEDKGIKTFHVYDLHCHKDRDKRRSEKWKFRAGMGRLKITSYHSYKGWESPNIILVLDSPSTKYLDEKIDCKKADSQLIKNALFISMSRVKGKTSTGEYTFTCLNYLNEYNHLNSIFDN